ncbi:BioY family protein [Erysipelotrichaceae bacterium MTC7]|nr:BioY family protein [Erysipelotrichaceae bacterium MTC7]
MKRLSTKQLTYMALFSVLIAVGAFIKIPVSIVPITLQTLFVVLAGLVLGKVYAPMAVLVYILVGLVGLPVFSTGGGPSYIFYPSFGYLIGFVFAAYFVGRFASLKTSMKKNFVVCTLGMLIIYLFGVSYFVFIQYVYYGKVFEAGWLFYFLFLVYLPGDVLSCLVASILFKRLPNITI